jgi:hypothetical protein
VGAIRVVIRDVRAEKPAQVVLAEHGAPPVAGESPLRIEQRRQRRDGLSVTTGERGCLYFWIRKQDLTNADCCAPLVCTAGICGPPSSRS